MPSILTITTDFGISDGYVGAMKGVIYDCARYAQVIDITHFVPPQDVAAGAFVMYSSCGFYPRDTVHIGVIDPGVGSERRGIVVETDRFKYVGPDNGLFSPVFAMERVRRIVAIENPVLMRPVVSSTFHGRDVFATVGAHLLNGVSCEEVGRVITDPVMLDLWEVKQGNDFLAGRVVHIDHFGNAISMISRSQVVDAFGERSLKIVVENAEFDRICRTYAEVGDGDALALYGSLDTLEISVNGGNAARSLGIQRGDEVRVVCLSNG